MSGENTTIPAAGPPTDADPDAAARGALYALLARATTEPDPDLYEALASGALDEQCRTLLDRTDLDVAPPDLTVSEDRETVCARYNDIFVVGHTSVEDRTDGTIDAEGPNVSLYESAYRPEASWNDVNLDLARAYDYFGVGVDEERRENHDHLRLELEFAGYLCRREAAVDPDAAAARLDFLDRHLAVLTEGVADAMGEEPGTGVFGEIAAFTARFVAADTTDLDARLHDEGAGGDSRSGESDDDSRSGESGGDSRNGESDDDSRSGESGADSRDGDPSEDPPEGNP